MRTIALYALMLALGTSPGTCERTNPTFCEINADCTGDKPVCNGGTCVARECSSVMACTNKDRPVCQDPGVCVKCTSNAQCAGTSGQYCDAGRCVTCRNNADCAKADAAICDPGTKTCRPCALHSECGADQLCAKDATLSTLPLKPILPGTCVPPERILTARTDAEADFMLGMVSPNTPYLRLVPSGNAQVSLNLSGLPGGLKVLHIVGPLADTPPTSSTITEQLPLSVSAPAGVAVQFNGVPSNGGTLILEGLPVLDSQIGVQCAGTGKRNETEVRILRSVFAGITDKAVYVNSECRLTVDQSWIGQGPGALMSHAGAFQSIAVDNSDMLLTNSVFWRTGRRTMFGGIQYTESPTRTTGGFRSYIVNCTFASTILANGAGESVADLKCGGLAVSNPGLLVMNSIFIMRDVEPLTGAQTHINDLCYKSDKSLLVSLGSDEQALGGVLLTGSPFESQDAGDFRLKDPQGPLVAGGAAMAQGISAPPIDLAGKARSATRPTIGALEVPH